MKENLPEKELIRGCRKGDRRAQHALYQAHRVYLFGICSRYAKSRDEAQDMLQEGFFQILKDIGKFSGERPLRAWMRRVMINAALMHLRKHHKLVYTDLEEQVLESHLEHDISLFQGERAQAIIALIRELPEIQQTVFNLKAIDGYSFAEIAKQIGIKEATLRSHFHRGRQQLQNLVKVELEKNG